MTSQAAGSLHKFHKCMPMRSKGSYGLAMCSLEQSEAH